MINTFVGNTGHFLILLSFVSSIVAAIGYFMMNNVYHKKQDLKAKEVIQWKRFSRIAFYIHGFAVIGVVVALFEIIYNHRYEYHYAWNHSSNNLAVEYMISCFWEGQEGSFLLWIFWHVLIGFILINTNKKWEAPVMVVFALVQAFLVSMILGIYIFGQKIGSSPFILLRESMDIPIYQPGSPMYNPDFVPEDGTGLNPLLQNYWMVIHPPTLFLGFALTLVPFAYLMAGLWQKNYKEWIRPALPWSLVGAGILGLGILMGGYWAYETLNFGGYWNWDPVENAVYIPWLVLVASIHTMISFKKSNQALIVSMLLVATTFILILYSTFLTRSGILGDASVHSFTDLGLSGQLLIYLLAFTGFAIFLFVKRWKELPATKEEISTYSREFWIFIGAAVLFSAGLQVLFTTSIPVYNKIIELIGFDYSIAPPADPIDHYTKFQKWFSVGIALLSGTGQFFWWKKMDKEQIKKALLMPVLVTMLVSSILIVTYRVLNFSFIILLVASIYSVIANSFILFSLMKKKTFKLAGGSVAHIGIAMMLIGILFSSGYSKIVSINKSGKIYSSEFSTEMNAENVLLWLNEPIEMSGYQISYKGVFIEAKQYPYYLKKSSLMPMENNPFQALVVENIDKNGEIYFERGDTVDIYPENTFYEVEYRDEKGRIFELFPRAQVNPEMGLLASPDIHRGWGSDLYTHVSSIPDPSQPKEWSDSQQDTLILGDTIFVNDYVAILKEVNPIQSDKLIQLVANRDAGMEAKFDILGENVVYEANPRFFIKNGQVGLEPDMIEELGVRIALLNIQPDEKDSRKTKFIISSNTTQKDYIIMKAMEKPAINVLWIGTLVVMLGFGIAVYRRYNEFIKMRDKGME